MKIQKFRLNKIFEMQASIVAWLLLLVTKPNNGSDRGTLARV